MKDKRSKILLVEDDSNLGYVVADSLREGGYEVKLAADGNTACYMLKAEEFDLYVLDIMLPGKDGFALAGEIRKADQQTPIIFLTAKSLPEDKIRGFKTGGDDYLTKPFNMEELLVRIEAILKRSGAKVRKDIFTIGNYLFDYKNLELKHPSGHRTLTKKEAELLRLLVLQHNEVLERETALKAVWGSDDYFSGRSMDVFVARLRKYLKEDERVKIVNVHGVGFRLDTGQEMLGNEQAPK